MEDQKQAFVQGPGRHIQSWHIGLAPSLSTERPQLACRLRQRRRIRPRTSPSVFMQTSFGPDPGLEPLPKSPGEEMESESPPVGLLFETFLREFRRLASGAKTRALDQLFARPADESVKHSEQIEQFQTLPETHETKDGAPSPEPNALAIPQQSEEHSSRPQLLDDQYNSNTSIAESAEHESSSSDGSVAGQLFGSVTTSSLPATMTDAVGKLVEIADEGASAIASGIRDVLNAVGVVAESEEDDIVQIPAEPAFDPVTALILAGYAFQAYLDPPRGAYWETFAASVQGSEVSGMERQIIHTRVAFMNTDAIAAAAQGVFMLRVDIVRGQEKEAVAKSMGWYIVVVLNGSALYEDTLSSAPLNFSLLKREQPEIHSDVLVLSIYDSKKGFVQGNPVLASGSILFSDLQNQTSVTQVSQSITMRAMTNEEAKTDFFEFKVLPENMISPFRNLKLGPRERIALADQVHGLQLSVHLSYVPFDAHQVGDATSEDDVDDEEADEGEVFDERMAVAVSESMESGQVPLDWGKLAKDLHEILQSMRVTHPEGFYVREDMQRALFIESLDTNSEVWLWRDESRKHIIISFRGTEQVEWQDFFTDALAFLQAWRPGNEIILDIKPGLTMGLDVWDSVLRRRKESENVDLSGAPCVHWGFLRAYLSLRESLNHSIGLLTNGFESDYTYYLTGHSLGGALATLAAADIQARYGGDERALSICMINYGSPRVGNRAFARLFNDLVPNSFRIVNGADLIARMPQTPIRFRGGYHHVGRICLVHENGTIWTEGAGATSFDFLFPTDMEQAEQLIELERKMWSLLVSGQSLGHHMEDSYYVALKNAVLQRFVSHSA